MFNIVLHGLIVVKNHWETTGYLMGYPSLIKHGCKIPVVNEKHKHQHQEKCLGMSHVNVCIGYNDLSGFTSKSEMLTNYYILYPDKL